MANSEYSLSPYTGSGAKIMAGVASVIFIGVAALLGYVIVNIGGGSITWDGKQLRTDGVIYHEEIAASDLRPAEAKVVDADSDQGLKIGSRKSGMKMPGYAEGWFQLGNGEKALLLLSGSDRSKVLYVPTKKDFSLLLSPTDSDALLTALRTPPAQAVTYQLSPPPASARLIFVMPLVVLLPVVIFFLLAGRAPKRVKAQLTEKGLRIQSLMSSKEIPFSEIDKQSVEVIKLGPDEPRRPRIRTFGLGLPGLLIGWARLANGEKALAYVTDPSQVLYFKTTAGYSVLFSSPESPALAAALRAR